MSRHVYREEIQYYNLPGIGSTLQERHKRAGWTSDFTTPTTFLSEHGNGFAGWFPNPVLPYYYALNAHSTRGIQTSIAQKAYRPLINKSFSELVETLKGDNANLLMLLGEGHESLKMIVDRLNKLHNAARALRRGNIRKFTRALRVKPKRRHLRWGTRKVAQNFSGLWLEYHFGWSPMLADMHDAAVFLSKPWSVAQKPRKGASSVDRHVTTVEEWWNTYSVHQGVDAIVSNPNKALVNRLGLANPVYVAWDLVPFSFVVDWFTDIGAFLGSFNAFYGYDTRNGFTTNLVRSRGEFWYLRDMPGNVPCRLKRVFMYRNLGLTAPLPNLNFLDNIGELWTKRGLTAVSLLTQVMLGSTK